MSNPEPDFGTTVSRFPFLMVLAYTMLRGFVFALLNGPMVILTLREKKFSDLSSLINTGIVPVWNDVVRVEGIFSAALLLLVCLSLGLLINPFERVLSQLVPYFIELIIPRNWRARTHRIFFIPSDYLRSEYVLLLGWLLKNPAEKLHWEYELWNYSLWWTLFTSVSTCSVLGFSLLGGPRSFAVIIALVAVPLVFLVFALAVSSNMAKVHAFYINQMDQVLSEQSPGRHR